jgi:hypothetical protein
MGVTNRLQDRFQNRQHMRVLSTRDHQDRVHVSPVTKSRTAAQEVSTPMENSIAPDSRCVSEAASTRTGHSIKTHTVTLVSKPCAPSVHKRCCARTLSHEPLIALWSDAEPSGQSRSVENMRLHRSMNRKSSPCNLCMGSGTICQQAGCANQCSQSLIPHTG